MAKIRENAKFNLAKINPIKVTEDFGSITTSIENQNDTDLTFAFSFYEFFVCK